MREELKNIIYMGLGAISLTGERAQELRRELLDKGESFYKQGMVKNEELKRNIKDKIKDSVTIEVNKNTKEDIVEAIKSMNDEEKLELEKLLKSSDKKVEDKKKQENKDFKNNKSNK